MNFLTTCLFLISVSGFAHAGSPLKICETNPRFANVNVAEILTSSSLKAWGDRHPKSIPEVFRRHRDRVLTNYFSAGFAEDGTPLQINICYMNQLELSNLKRTVCSEYLNLGHFVQQSCLRFAEEELKDL